MLQLFLQVTIFATLMWLIVESGALVLETFCVSYEEKWIEKPTEGQLRMEAALREYEEAMKKVNENPTKGTKDSGKTLGEAHYGRPFDNAKKRKEGTK